MAEDYNADLKNAWDSFCDRLKEAGRTVLDPPAADSALDRASGVQYLTRYISKALNEKLEFADPLYPQLRPQQTPTSKSIGDNPDCTYLITVVDGDHSYRIVGNRGSVSWVSFFIREGGTLNNSQLQTEWDGSFVITLSQKEAPGNWIKLMPGLNHITVRQFFGHWDTEEPMRLAIERVGLESPPPVLTPQKVVAGLSDAATWLIDDITRWVEWVDYYAGFPNQWVANIPPWRGDGGVGVGQLSGAVNFCYWKVRSDEALIVRVKPPRCSYWNVQMHNYWMNSVDYRYRLSSVNKKQAAVEDDGTAYIVVSHVDPGIPNWLDTGGHCIGLLVQLLVEAEATPLPENQLVKLAKLDAVLPANIQRIDHEARRDQLRRRKIGVDRRFRQA
jgi:hypothetical protein